MRASQSKMSEVYQRYLPPDRNGPPVAAPLLLWRRAVAIVANVRTQFVALVVAPTIVASLYYGLIAAPQYVSQTAYVVRGVDAHHASGLASLLNTFGVSRAADETSAIETFLKSRDVLARLNARIDLRAVYGSHAADWFSRFPHFWERDSFEGLFAYTRSFLTVKQDSTSGVTRLEVAAFDPQSAQTIAAAMLAAASEMANNLNARAETDTIQDAKRELQESRDDVVKIQGELTAFRNATLLVDPLAFAGAMLQDIGALSLRRARAETQVAEAEQLSPDNPSLQGLRASAGVLDKKIEEERAKLAGGSTALASKVTGYERLTLLRGLAEKRYASALLSLQAAEAEVQRKRVYIEEIAKPNLPDEATRPQRLRDVLSTFVVGFMAFSLLWILSVGSKDHAQ